MRIALIDSGLGLLAAAAELLRLRPDADLVLAMDPDGMPWGPRTPQDIAQRCLTWATAAARYQPDVMIMACNTGTVSALEVLRAKLEPRIPVVGTVPAIKPAAAACGSLAIWATVATTASEYQRRLIASFAAGARVAQVACPGLADAIDAGDGAATAAAIADAASRTPAGCEAVVLGCTHYELVTDRIRAALPGMTLFSSAPSVAAQALRRATPPGVTPLTSATGPASTTGPASPASQASRGDHPAGTLYVLLSGRPADLPAAAASYPAGRLVARLARGREPDAGPDPRCPVPA
jgi:glutamate racemase